jgi:hypothetical protein
MLPPYQRGNRFRRWNEECFKFRYIRVNDAEPNRLLFGFGDDADGAIDDRLAGEAIVVRFVFEPFDFDRGAGGEVFHAFDHFHDTGATLAKAAAVHHLAHHRVEVDAVFHGFDPQVGAAGGHHFLAFIDEFDVGACYELGLLLRVHKPSLVAEGKCYGWKVLSEKFRVESFGALITAADMSGSVRARFKHLNADWPDRCRCPWD